MFHARQHHKYLLKSNNQLLPFVIFRRWHIESWILFHDFHTDVLFRMTCSIVLKIMLIWSNSKKESGFHWEIPRCSTHWRSTCSQIRWPLNPRVTIGLVFDEIIEFLMIKQIPMIQFPPSVLFPRCIFWKFRMKPENNLKWTMDVLADKWSLFKREMKTSENIKETKFNIDCFWIFCSK